MLKLQSVDVFMDYKDVVHHKFLLKRNTHFGVIRRVREAIRSRRPDL